ncbi:MAG: response regulator, partial [Deltaproteobacteria bacterium]|nr:response regulator [Deltaproteobacteria bacterium]
DRIVLSHGQSDFSVAFAALNYRAPDRNRYAYRLEGFDADWIFTDSSHRRASYSGLKEGTYRFLVKASNNDGLWNEEGTALGIVIAPPWWRSVWFNGLAAMMTAGLLFAAYRWRIASMKKRNRDLETLVSLRTREIAESLDHLAQARNQAEAARQQAEKASKTKSIFLANMSHELRTPLNSILGYAQILRGRAASDDSLVDGLAAIRQSGDHLLTLINDILDIAKIEAGKIDLFPAPTYLPGFIDGIVNLIKNRAEAKDLSLTYEPRPPLPSGVMVDEKRLRQVLVNLLGNAVKFTERGGVGLIVERLDSPDQRTGPPTATLRFTVEDTGIGIPPLELEGLFRPFVQVGHADKQIEGAGLGLTISQQIVTLMDSRIRVKSEPGKGSAFWFEVTLPVVEIAVEEQTAQRRMPTGYEGPRRKVLVVDDKRYHRFILEAMLAPLGFEISTANDGQQAVDKALAERPDVILMDLVMPVKTGLEAIQEIRRNADMDDVIIIAVSASVMEIDRAKSQVAGCNAFLPKPVRIEDLTVLMGKHMGLNWIYGKPEQETDSAEKASVKQLVPLPPEEMEALHELIKAGKLRQFRDRLAALEETDEQSRPFIQRLQSMARGYEIKRIMTLLQREREEKQ